jgi:hypothetical protein
MDLVARLIRHGGHGIWHTRHLDAVLRGAWRAESGRFPR